MGFGSYDESEQQNQDVVVEDQESEGVSVHANDYEGEFRFETGDSTDNLVSQLAEIKARAEEEEEA